MIPILNQIDKTTIDFPVTAIFSDKERTLIATKTGSLLNFDTSTSLNLNNQISGLIHGSTVSIVSLGTAYSILSSDGSVSIFDATVLEKLETLGFKNITHQVQFQHLHRTILAISTRNLIVLFEWYNDQLEMIQRLKMNEKVLSFEVISFDHFIWTSGNNFYSYKISTGDNRSIPLQSKYSVFNRQVTVIPNGNKILISKGINAIEIDQELNIIKDNFQWEHTPQFPFAFINPFLIFPTGNHLYVKDFKSLKTLQIIDIPKVTAVSVTNEYIIAATKDSILLYKFNPLTEVIENLEKQSLDDAIAVLEQLNKEQYPDKSLKLRELGITLGIQQFRNRQYRSAIQKFTEFVAPPFRVIKLYPMKLTGIGSTTDFKLEDIDKNTIFLLTQFITDSRRKLNRLLNTESQTLDYKEDVLTLSMFTEKGRYTIDQIRTVLDTTLFRCYAEINVGLIGSLVRVDNYLDPKLVISTLQSKNLTAELIDFYYKREYHEKALELLTSLCRGNNSPDLLVKYLQRLKNDKLDLIIKYAEWPIEVDERHGLEIFVDSQYSDTFTRSLVLKFLANKSKYLERMYLEYVVVELEDHAQIFNTKLAVIYFDSLAHEEFNIESIYYKKLYSFLQSGTYDLNQLLSKFSVIEAPANHILILKTFILSRLGKHNEVLKTFVFQIDEPALATHYVNQLYEKDSKIGEEHFIRLTKFFWDHNKDKSSILKLLTSTKNTHIPLLQILKNLPNEFKIYEIENFLIKSIRLQQKISKYSNLERHLRELENVKTEAMLYDKTNVKFDVIVNETKCPVCQTYLSNSVISRFPDGKIVHFGCSSKLQALIDANEKFRKLKSIKLGDYNSHS